MTVEELIDTSLTVSTVGECLSLTQSYHPLSLDLSLGDRDADSLIETLTTPDRELDAVPERVVLSAVVRRLAAADQQLLRMRFVEDFTQRQIADALGISQMRVSRQLKLALGRVRALMVTADGYGPDAARDVDQRTTWIGARRGPGQEPWMQHFDAAEATDTSATGWVCRRTTLRGSPDECCPHVLGS